MSFFILWCNSLWLLFPVPRLRRKAHRLDIFLLLVENQNEHMNNTGISLQQQLDCDPKWPLLMCRFALCKLYMSGASPTWPTAFYMSFSIHLSYFSLNTLSWVVVLRQPYRHIKTGECISWHRLLLCSGNLINWLTHKWQMPHTVRLPDLSQNLEILIFINTYKYVRGAHLQVSWQPKMFFSDWGTPRGTLQELIEQIKVTLWEISTGNISLQLDKSQKVGVSTTFNRVGLELQLFD